MKDYRARRAACVASGQVWFPDPDPEPESQPKVRPEPEERWLRLAEDVEALPEQTETPQSWYSSLTTARSGVIAAGVSLAVGLGVMTWYLVNPPSKQEEEK